jgi:hypothetical protein
MTDDVLPPALGQLVCRLTAHGYTTTAEQSDDKPFGYWLIELADPTRETGRTIRLVRERGLWSVEIEIGGRWRDPYQVLLAIDGLKHSTRASSHDERLRFTLDALDRMPSAASIQPVIDRLAGFDREYSRRFVKHEGHE